MMWYWIAVCVYYTSIKNNYDKLLKKVGIAVPINIQTMVGMTEINQVQRSSLPFSHPFIKVIRVGKIEIIINSSAVKGYPYF